MISTLIFSAHDSMKTKPPIVLYLLLYCLNLNPKDFEYTIYYTLKHYKFVEQQGLNSGLYPKGQQSQSSTIRLQDLF